MFAASDLRKGLKIQGNQQSQTYRSNEKFEKPSLSERKMQFLYNQDDEYHFMDTENYEQTFITKDQLGDNIKFLQDNMELAVLFFDDKPIDVTLPIFVNLVVTVAEPWAKGDTSGNDTKPVTVESGFELQVPPFVVEGDKIQIDTRTGAYVTRVKE